MTRKIIALLMAYSFFATSVWSLALPVEPLGGKATNAMGWSALRGPSGNRWRGASGSLDALSSGIHTSAMPKIFSNIAELSAAAMVPGTGGGVSSSITSNFNGTAIPAGDTIWFSAVLKLNGTVPKSPVNIAVDNSTIQFTAGSKNYSLNVPAAVVTFAPSATTSTVTFDTANNASPVWLENQLNPQPSGNTLLQAFAFPVPAGGLPGGIQNVTWQSSFTSDTANISLNWQWAAAVYTGCVSTTYNSDDVKPTDDTSASIYKNSDHAGTPEACKNFVGQGATGGGGSNYTGSLSGTASVTPAVASASPVITASISPAANSAHWNNSNVTVSFACSDANFAIATCPAPVAVNTEGAGQVITGTAVDQTGATATTSVTVNLDKTSPSITAAATSSSGGGSVLTLPVTVTFTCADTLSGVASCPSSIQVTTPGAHEVFSGTATDKAGNTATASISITTEQAPLAMTASLTPPPLNGWNNTTVSVSYQCTGGVPPVQCAQGTTVSGEGAGQVISATATDAGGQSATLNTTINIDETPPTLTATTTPAANAADWNTTAVTVSYACSDNLSGVAVCPPPQVVSTEGKGQQITASATDIASNSTSVITTLNIELTAPQITAAQEPAANAAGWNNSDVTVRFTCTPSVSDLVSCPAPVSVTTEGNAQQISGVVTDQAGKSNTATIPVSLDKTPPSIVIATPITLPIAVSYSDSGSGIDTTSFKLTIDGVNHTAEFTVTATGATGSPAALGLGSHVITATVSDVAGNPSSATATLAADTTPPTISITTPANGSLTNNNRPPIAVTYSSTSGINVASFKLTIDGADHTGEFTATATGASGSPTAPLVDGQHSIVATVNDLRGNASSPATANVTIDTIAPAVSITSPVSGSFSRTNQPAIAVTYSDSGSGINTTSFKLTIDGVDHTAELTATASGASGSPAAALVDGSHSIVATVSDQAGNTSSPATATVTVDTSLPSISITAPASGSFTNNNRPAIAVTFGDSGSSANPASFRLTIDGKDHTAELAVTATGASGSPALPLSDGNHVILATVSDQAGNSSSASTSLTIDTVPPQITISQPSDQSFSNANSLTVTGTVTAAAPITAVTVAGVTASLSSGAFSAPVSLGPEGPQAIPVSARDAAGNTGQKTVTVTIDRTPPVVTLTTPPQVSKLHSGQISVTATDNLSGVSQVVVSVNAVAIATFTGPPYQTTLTVPAGSNPGDTLTVTAVATDRAGNSGSATPHGVSVAGDNNVIVGQVLNDVNSLPLQNANVQMIAATAAATPTDDRGRYSLQATDSHLFLSVSGTIPGVPPAPPTPTTTVEREVFVQQGVGTVPVDARLTPLATAVTVGSAGGTLTAGLISITVPAGAVSDGTSFHFTPLSGQGLPGLLPLGWSPLAAFDLRSSALASNLSGAVSQLPNVVTHLVTYNPSLHAWIMVASNLQSVNASASFTVPATGAYALVVPDTTTPPVPIPDTGGPLTGITMQLLDPAASSGGSLNPAILPAGGGTATATLGIQSPSFAPSGTIIQANVSERFSLASGDVVSEQTRSEDIVLYKALAPANASMGAQFPVTPSHKYSNAQLLTGKVHLDILAGRESVRGQPGGNDPLTIGDGISTLSVPGGALGVDTAISVQSTALEDFVPTSSSMSAIQEVLVDFSGEFLNTPAQLSISSSGLSSNHTFLLTQVQRINGVPHMVAVAVAQINGQNLTSVASPGLPGVISGGEYVFYDIASPAGFVTGVAKTTAGPVQALVQTDLLQIVSITGADGHYIVPALAGTVNLKANGTNSSVAGTASTQLTASQVANVDIQLNGVVNAATVSPADRSLGVPTSTVITITAPVPIDPTTIKQGNLALFQGTPAAPVALQPFVLSTSGTVLTFAPVQNLAAATQYTIQVTGLADLGGGAIVVPTSTFTTKANQPLTFDPNAIVFGFPDQNGNIHVSAPAGSLPPVTKVLIIDQSNAVVLSLTAFNDGSLSGDFPGTINDVLQVTVTDPNGATASFTRSQFVAADGSVAVGPGGGRVTGPGGVELRIPAGALDKGATFKIEAFGPDLFPDRPDVPGGTFGGGLKITSPDNPVFKQEAKLAFPMPAGAPAGAFFQVYQRLQAPNNQVLFEDLDYALPEGQGSTAKVVTASFPYRGLIDLNMLLAQADFQGQALDIAFSVPPVAQLGLQAVMFIIWTANDILPGVALGGSVTGRVRYAVPPGGTMPDGTINRTGDTAFVGVLNALVTVDSNPPSHALLGGATGARTQPDGSFTFSDPHYNGGTVNLIAYDGNGHAVTASAVEAVGLTDKTVNDFAGPLLKFYRNVAFANIVVPAPAPPPPTPQIGINFFTENPNSNPPGQRVPVNGIITAGTSLVVAFKTGAQIANPPNVTINGVPYSTQADQPTVATDPNKLDFELNQPFVPGTPAIYTLTATGSTAFGQPISASKSFMVIAPGGSNNRINVGVAPIIASVSPVAGAESVPVNTFVQVLFNEPVTNLAGHVSLVPADGSAPPPLTLSGIDYRDGVTVIPSLSATSAVASMTIQPLAGLKFNTKYTLQITTDVVNLDNVADPTKTPLKFIPPEQQSPPVSPYDFTTFGPQVLGGTAAFGSTRPVVLGERAYVAIPGITSIVKTFDISDPTNPTEITTSTTGFIGRAFDIAGEENAAVIGGSNLIAATAGFASEALTVPSNMWLYNVSGDQMVRVGAVSVTSSVNTGQAVRVALKGNFAYTYVAPSTGIEVVDLQQAISDYTTAFASDPRQFGVAVTTEGQGFATDAVVNTIPVQDSTGKNVWLWGIQAGDFVLPGSDPQNPVTQTFVVATGGAPASTSPTPITFVVADPTQPGPSALVYSGQPSRGASKLTYGMALALGQLTDSIPDANGNPVVKPVAIVVGSGTAPDPANPGQTKAGGVLAVMDLTDPSKPLVMSVLAVPGFPTDVVLHDTTAIVGTNPVLLVNLVDPRNPVNAGSINGTTFGDRLAVTKDGILVGSSMDVARGGIQIATLGVVPSLTADASVLVPDQNGLTASDLHLTYKIGGDLSQIQSATVEIDDPDGKAVFTQPVPVKATGTTVWKAGQPITVTPTRMTIQVTNPSGLVSDWLSADASYDSGDVPTPVIQTMSPSTITAGGSHLILDFKGRNYLSSTALQLVGSNGVASSLILPTQLVTSHEIKFGLPDSFAAQPSQWTVSLFNGFRQSNKVTLKVLPANLPPAPVLLSAVPSALPTSDNPSDVLVTLNGANFVQGDSVAVFAGTQSPIQTQFVSNTQLQVLVPAAWQSGGQVLDQISVQSLQHPDLTSASVAFQILDDVTQPPFISDTETPQLTSLENAPGDFVPLVISADIQKTNPITITLNGQNLKPGAKATIATDQKVVDVPLSVLLATQVQAQVPPNLWRVAQYHAFISLKPSSGPVLKSPTLPLNTAPVTFSNAVVVPTNHPTVESIRSGFHARTLAEHSAQPTHESFLSLKLGGNNDNNNRVNVSVPTGYLPADNSQSINLVPDDTQVFATNPQHVQTGTTPVQLSSQAASNTTLTQLHARTATQAAPQNVGVLGVQAMPIRNVNVYVHFVANAANGANAPNGTNSFTPSRYQNELTNHGVLDQQRLANFDNNLQNGLNQIWTSQTNVTFTVIPPTTMPEVIHYANPGDSGLALMSGLSVQNANGVTVCDGEDSTQATPENDVLSGVRPTNYGTTNVHLIFVRQFSHAVNTVAQTWSIGGIDCATGVPGPVKFRALFVPDRYQYNVSANSPQTPFQNLRTGSDEFYQVIAHEIGHALGLHHTCQYQTNTPGAGCGGHSQNLFIANDSSDYRDSGTLMWPYKPPDHQSLRTHIGAPNWFELNDANPQ